MSDKTVVGMAGNTGKCTLPTKMIDHVSAYANFVLVKENAARDQAGTIVIPDAAKKREWSTVLSAGPDCKMFTPVGETAPRKLQAGDVIQYYTGVNVRIDGNEYQAIADGNVMLVFPANRLNDKGDTVAS